MTEIKMINLAEAIAKYINGDCETYVSDEINYILGMVDFKGKDNEHLSNPLNKEKFYFCERNKPLSGEEIVQGDYLLYKYTGHSEDMYLIQYYSLTELEERLSSKSSYMNIFCTYAIPIVYGKIKKYEILFEDKFDGNTYTFQKGYHDCLEYGLFERMINPRIQWLD